MLQPTHVKALPNYRLGITYSDGVSGEVDLADLAGQGVFALWNEPGAFENVQITPWRAIAWSDQVEICADSLYLRLTGKSSESAFPSTVEPVYA